MSDSANRDVDFHSVSESRRVHLPILHGQMLLRDNVEASPVVRPRKGRVPVPGSEDLQFENTPLKCSNPRDLVRGEAVPQQHNSNGEALCTEHPSIAGAKLDSGEKWHRHAPVPETGPAEVPLTLLDDAVPHREKP